ncbi:hypothetical protein Tco_0912531 [Tanacetum coccineum]
MQKQFDVGVSKMKSFRANRIATDKMTDSFREQYSLLREYAQELINQNPGTTVRINVQQEPNPKSLTRTFRRVYVCLGALKQGFRACGREILGLNGCLLAYAIVEVEIKASWCWFLNLLGEDLAILNLNFPQGLIQAIASVFPSAEHRFQLNNRVGPIFQAKPNVMFLALGWHLEEIHMTWAHLEKKRTRLRVYTKYLEEPRIQSVETASPV